MNEAAQVGLIVYYVVLMLLAAHAGEPARAMYWIGSAILTIGVLAMKG